jgi:hypothetical protein
VIVQGGDGRPRYEFDRNGPPIPFTITDYDEGEPPWREETCRMLRARFPVAGPLAAITVFRSRPLGCSELILAAHHAIADGQSAMIILDDLLTEYANAEASREAAPRPALPVISAVRAIPSGGWLGRFRLIRRFFRIQRDERRLPVTILPEAQDIPPLSQWVHWVVAREDTLKLIRRCRKEQASFGGALMAAMCCGLMDCLPVPAAVFKCQLPFDVRDTLEGPVTAEDLGCFVSVMNEFYEVPQQPAFWALARRAHQNMQAFVQQGGPSRYYNLVGTALSRRFARAASWVASSGKRTTVFFTNYGVLKIRDAYGSLRPRECTLTFDNGLDGPKLIMEALVMGQRLNVGLVADRLDPAFWNRLHVAVRRHLEGAAGLPETAPGPARQPVRQAEVAPQRMSVAAQE